jgi:ribonucleoside-diphosphate reductase beta chain
MAALHLAAPDGAAATQGRRPTGDTLGLTSHREDVDVATTVTRAAYQTTSERGLRFGSVPMRLFDKAKKLGTWDPNDLDFSRDRADWDRFTDEEKDFILRTVSLFQAGEEAVTLDLLPLIMAVARDGHVEDEIYLTSFLWEEAKHVTFFRRWLDEVAEVHTSLDHYMSPSYRTLFLEALPAAMNRLIDDSSRQAQIEASVTYNMIIEGVLAETGYEGFRRSLRRNQLMPGLLAGIDLTARDESRHIRYGVYLLDRLVAEDDTLWPLLGRKMNELFPYAMALIGEFWDNYDSDHGPFGTTMMEFIDFSSDQFDRRMRVLERDRGKNLAEVERAVLADIDAEETAEAAASA